MSAVAELPPHVARPRLPYTPRYLLDPHERGALKPALVPLLPPDARCQVRTHTETEVIVGATLQGHRIVLRTRCPSKLFSAADWAAEVARRLLSWRPPALPQPLPSVPIGSPAWDLRHSF